MKPPISRRRFLYTGGLGATGLMLGACSNDSPESSTGTTAASGTSTSTSTSTGTGSSGGATSSVPDCVLVPEQTEGPFYTDVNLVRRDITDGRAGTPVELRLTIVDADTCQPIADATADIWHADADGLYSSFPEQGDSRDLDTSSESFLRGVQAADPNGIATFSSIYPGWYPGRTTHLHLKVHLDDSTRVTTQLYFPDDVTDAVYQGEGYRDRGPKDTPNSSDRAEPALLMTVEQTDTGFLATHTIGISRT